MQFNVRNINASISQLLFFFTVPLFFVQSPSRFFNRDSMYDMWIKKNSNLYCIYRNACKLLNESNKNHDDR
jgi:hypothetical protein